MMFGDMEELMHAFGGGMPGMHMMPGMSDGRRRKGRDVGLALPVTLEDLYNGKVVELPHDRTVLCTSCKGKGTTKEGSGGQCPSCRGAGAKIVRRQIGPMIQQMQVPCDACNGEGFKIDPKDRCTACKGNRTTTLSKPLRVTVEPGMEHQQQIPFRGEGDEQPGVEPGDIVIVLQQQKHATFQRHGNDLVIHQRISIEQALCGFEIIITHLDGRSLLISNKGSIIKPDDVKVVAKEGMPIYNKGSPKNKGAKGDLIIVFTVEFPDHLEENQVAELRKVLPPPPAAAAAPSGQGENVYYVQRESLDDVRHMMAQEDDDEEERGGAAGGVPCAQQ